MTVQELINFLLTVEDKTMLACVLCEHCSHGAIYVDSITIDHTHNEVVIS